MTPVYVYRWGEWLRRLVGAKGGFSLSLLDDIMPVANILDTRPESYLRRAEFLFAQALPVSAGGAATFAEVFFQPVAGHVFVITGIFAQKATAGDVTVLLSQSTGTVALTAPQGALDSRVPGVVSAYPLPLNLFTSAPAVVNGGTQWRATLVANTVGNVNFPPCILTNPTSLIVQNQTANEALSTWVTGYHYQPAPEE